MAGIYLHATSLNVAVGAAVTKTILAVRPAANDRLRISSWGVGFNGTSATDNPILCQLVRQTNTGTFGTSGAGAAGQVYPKDADVQETIQTSGFVNASAEPTLTNVIDEMYVHPQTGFLKLFPMGQEVLLSSPGATVNQLGIRVITGAAYSGAGVVAELDLEE